MRKYGGAKRPFTGLGWVGGKSPADLVAEMLKAEAEIDNEMARVPVGWSVAPERRGEIVLHRMGRVIVQQYVTAAGLKWYEALVGEQYFHGASPRLALRAARRTFPKPPKPPTRVVGEIVAFRVWNLRGDCLTPVTRGNEYWDGPVLRADGPPELTGSSGLHSVKLDQRVMRELVADYNPSVYGFVAVYGTVVEHEAGYRSSHQAVRKLVLRFPASDAFLRILAERYQCDVKIDRGPDARLQVPEG